jgi:hypothetical protein
LQANLKRAEAETEEALIVHAMRLQAMKRRRSTLEEPLHL